MNNVLGKPSKRMKVNTRQWSLWTKVGSGLVSTARLPITISGKDYETCVFFNDGNSEVVDQYETQVEAAKDHARHVSHLGGRVWL